MSNKKCGYRYTEEDLKNNFMNLFNELGRSPLFNEFVEKSKITDTTYATRLNLKGKVYDNIVKYYVSDEEYDKYTKMQSEHKTKVGKTTGKLSTIYTDEDLKSNFIEFFDTLYLNYKSYPSKRLFSKISKFDDSYYRKRYNKSWTDVCKMYGYDITDKNKEEYICLNMCKEILGCDFKSQKTWDWLIGIGGKNMYCDGYFEDINLVIEFDGAGHRKVISKFGGEDKFTRQIENDNKKEKLLNDNNINIIRIDSRLKWYEKDKLKEIITNECVNRGVDCCDFFNAKNK